PPLHYIFIDQAPLQFAAIRRGSASHGRVAGQSAILQNTLFSSSSIVSRVIAEDAIAKRPEIRAPAIGACVISSENTIGNDCVQRLAQNAAAAIECLILV